MIITKTWFHYFFKEVLKAFVFFMLAACIIFCIVDYPTQPFHRYDIPISVMGIYYLCQFSYRAEILIPLCLMLAAIKVMCSANINREFVVLLAGGIRRSRLIFPFLFFAIICTMFTYYNFEILYPKSLSWIAEFKESYLAKAIIPKRDKDIIYDILLEDGSTLVYKSYSPITNTLSDIYWIKSIDDVYKMKKLSFNTKKPTGYFVNRFSRNGKGELNITESHKERSFDRIEFDADNIHKILTPPKERPISLLWQQISKQKEVMTDKKANEMTTLYKKLMMPLLSILVVIGSAPFCMQFHRNLPVFRIFTLSLLAFIIFITTINAASILGINKVLHPALAIFAPMGFFTIIYKIPVLNYARKRMKK